GRLHSATERRWRRGPDRKLSVGEPFGVAPSAPGAAPACRSASVGGVSSYDVLTPAEQTTFNECARLHQLEDWADFTADQRARLEAADAWIRAQRKTIYDLAEGNTSNSNGPGWDVQHRRERYDYLHTCQMGAAPHSLADLPSEGAMDMEGVLIAEREMWWMNP